MSTVRALSHLSALIDLSKRADQQIQATAAMLGSVIEQMDAILNDEDRPVEQVLVENSVGNETKFQLPQEASIKSGSERVVVDGAEVPQSAFVADEATGVISLKKAAPSGKRIAVRYTELGLKAQTQALIEELPELSGTHFANKRAHYLAIQQWLKSQ